MTGTRPDIDTLRYYLLLLVLKCLAFTPLPLLHGLARVGGWLTNALPSRAKSTTYKNLQTCFADKSEPEIAALAKDSLGHTVATALEMGKAWAQPVSWTIALVKEEDGYQEFLAAGESGKGVILLAPHLSNWEIFGFYACQDLASNFMYQPPRSAAMDRLLKEVRSRSGVQMAPTSRAGVAQVLAALKRGEMVGVLPDQVPADGSGEFAPFFGEPAYTMTLVSKLAQRTGAHVFCGFAQRLPGGRGFKAVFRRADETIYSSDIEVSLAGLNRSVEDCVQLAPAQYQWEYKRFRRRPDNQEFY